MVAVVLIAFAFGGFGLFMVLLDTRARRPRRRSLPATPWWPALDPAYAELPPEDRAWLFENLRLAGVQIEPPSTASSNSAPPHLHCAEMASAEGAWRMAAELLDKPAPTSREITLATHLFDLAERTAVHAREIAPRPYDSSDCEEVKIRDASGRVVRVVPGHRPSVRTPAKTVNAGDTLTFPPGYPRAPARPSPMDA